MRAKASAAIAALIGIVALSAPGAASAHGAPPGHSPHDRQVVANLTLLGSHGYAVGVTLTNHNRLKITVIPEREKLLEHLFEFASTEYLLEAPQPRGSNRIKASLGRFGSIDLRFEPEEEFEQPAPFGCKGDKIKVRVGYFVGHVGFRGERGYTAAHATKAVGTISNFPRPDKKCPDTAGKKPHVRSPQGRARATMLTMARKSVKPGTHLLGLGARKANGNLTVGLAALRLSGPTKKGKERAVDTFLATARRDRGRIQEQGTSFALLEIGPYFKVPDLDHPTAEAVLAPPKPLLGTATYRRESEDDVSWTGDLRAKLPGFGVVPLAGDGFEVAVCADSGCRHTRKK